MKKTSIRIVALMAIALILCAFSACLMPSGNRQDTTADPTIGSEELQDIDIQHNATMQVNIQTAVAGIYHVGNNQSYLTDVEFTVKAFDVDGNELPADMYEYEMNENGIIMVKTAEIGSITINATTELGKTAEASIPVTRQSLTLWDIILLGIGMYALYMGITGKGKIYAAEFVKAGMEARHRNVTRIACIAVSVCMVASGIIAAIDAYGKYNSASDILFVVATFIFIAAIVATGTMIDKQAKKEAEAKRMQGRDLKAPSAAFNFDDDEPTVDDLKK